ncbi:hypothetical protein PV05_00233 [Exophiala xenobiotica]|uniref:Pisatin demethylase n=1 Tax=Exophiala xenobiotica TaxID=348802 RepID=A0A0D2C512_9EURO|nr:uncharacterized protein PV05_00233 [Exophiala xenobiotica]KIW59976.1 hypothetical protein PV05_00233 [Exophiala xenobiotica]
MEKLVDENTHVFVNKMESKAGEPVNLGDWVQWYAFDVIGTITFLKPFGCMQVEGDMNNMIRNTDTSFRYVSVVGQMPKLHRWLLGSPTGVKLLSRIPFFAKANHWPYIGVVAARAIHEYDSRSEEEKGRCANLLAGFRQAQAKHPERLTDRDLMGFLFANIAAGSDTTAVTLRSLFYHLVRTPGCYSKLTDEIRAAENAGALSSPVTYQEGLNLKYLQAVIKETLRIHPGTPLPLERVVPPEGANLCGTFVPGGTTVGVSAWVVQRDKRVYGADANKFRPERWLEPDADQLRLMERTFLRFGGGARSCIGKNISILEVTKLVPQVLRKFKLEWASPEKDWVVESYFVAKQKGVVMRLIPHSVKS